MKEISLTNLEFQVLEYALNDRETYSDEGLLNKGIQHVELLDDKMKPVIRFIVKGSV